MIDPITLKRNPNRLYSFKSPFKTLAIRCVDAIGKAFFSSKAEPIPWQNVQRIAVFRLDHLGDVLLALPAVKALEEAMPKAQIDFFIGPGAKDVVEIAELKAAPKFFEAKWFSRTGAKGDGVKGLEGLLRQGKYDAVIELRGDFRHILAMHRAGIKYRIGLARTGLGFLLTHPLAYKPGLHEIERNFDTLEQAGIQLSTKPESPRLFPRKEDDQSQKEVRHKLGITKPVIAIHAISPVPSKRWSAIQWKNLIDKLPGDMDVVMVGTEAEKPELEEIQNGCKRKVFSTAGLLNLPALAALLKDSRSFIGIDSGPAHIAAAVGTPVVSLYSGTNVVGQWGPRGPRVTVIQKTPPCSPCELTLCPIGNDCMGQISVDEVLGAVTVSLR